MRKTLGPWASVVLFSLAAFSGACSSDDTPAGPVDAAAGSAGASGGAGDDSGGTAGVGGSGGSSGGAVDGGAGTLADGGEDVVGNADGGSDAATGDAGTKIASSTGTWVIYPDPFGADAGVNPLPSTIMGKAEAYALPGGKMRIALSVTGLPPNRPCGSHLHVLACDNNKAGGHYQHMPFPTDGGSASDPTFANGANEVWLDFTSDANGAAIAETTVNWVPRAGGANAIMIHDKKTGDGGIAGAKLACTNMPF